MSRLNLEEFEIDLRHIGRIKEIFNAYRIKLTGSLECRKERRIFDFIYREQPLFASEILMIMYQIGYEDGKKAARQAKLKKTTRQAKLKKAARQAKNEQGDEQDNEQDCAGIAGMDSNKPIGRKANLRLVVDNTINRPDPDPPPANTAVSILAA